MQSSPELFWIQAAHTDHDALQMMAVGYLLFDTDELSRENANMLCRSAPLRSALIDAMIKGKICGTGEGTEFRLYCHQASIGSDFKGFHLLAGTVEPKPNEPWISETLRAHASDIVGKRRVRLAGIAAKEAIGMLCDDEYSSFLTSQSEVELSPELLANEPVAIAVSVRTTDTEKLQQIARKAILASDTLSPYGRYTGILASAIPDEADLVLLSKPFKGLPSFDDIKNAVQYRLPMALRKPRLDNVAMSTSASTDAISVANVALHRINGFDTRSPTWKTGFSDGQYNFDEREQGARRGRDALKSHGFEAIAWYQPWHTYCDEAWGIYFDARMLDDVVCAFLEDLNHDSTIGISDGLASQLFFGLVYEHEIFHARLEASTASQELTATKSRYVRYQDKVYRPTLGTSACLEEALANWWAWSWLQAESALMLMSGLIRSQQQDALIGIVNATLDLSPPGYSDWRLGHDRESWRQLATQVTSGKQTHEFGLPIEALLKGPLLFEFKPEDVPLHFVGDGQVCQRVLSSPATLNLS